MKQQETLEEAAERFYSTEDTKRDCNFIEGAKWQQEQDKNKYSEKDIINALHSVELKDNKDYSKIYKGMKEWFELKNK
jgi:hypothetical protein